MSTNTQMSELLMQWEDRKSREPGLTPDQFLGGDPILLGEFTKLLKGLNQLDAALLSAPQSDVPSLPALSGRYKPIQFHAQGGLGSVFLARDQEIGRDVAIKVMQPLAAVSAASRRRFVSEAELTGSLEHPGIVPVYSILRDSRNQPYYAMRYIRGKTLADTIKECHASGSGDASAKMAEIRRLLKHFVAVCETIGYAHSRGVVHRDLKPKNIMIGEYGETLVVDWGCATLRDLQSDTRRRDPSTTVTTPLTSRFFPEPMSTSRPEKRPTFGLGGVQNCSCDSMARCRIGWRSEY